MAQVTPAADTTQRLFQELKSKNEDTRNRAATELHENIIAASRGKTARLEYDAY